MDIINSLDQCDKSIFLFLNGLHNYYWDYVMTLFTMTSVWIPFYLVILIIIVKKYGKESLWIFLAVILLILVADQFSGILKHTIKRLRPSHDPGLSQLTHIVFTKGGLYSFVSAHAANSFSFAIFFILLFRNRAFTLFIIPWAAMIAYTRIYLGVHYPGDILGGTLLGIIVGISIYKLLSLFEKKYSFNKTFLSKSLTSKEARTIVYTGLGMIILSLLITGLLMNFQLLNPSFQ
jgi:undecaprenyl-diphosphatase